MGFRRRLFAIWIVFLTFGSLAAAEGLRVVEHGLPPTLDAGSQISVSVVVANGGSLIWSPAEEFALSYHWLDADGKTVVWDGRRSPFTTVVTPGSSAELVATVEAPHTPGRYLLLWDVVQEGVRWISEIEIPPEPVPISVTAGHAFGFLEGSPPRLMVVGATTVVELVIQNDGGTTWLDDGSFAVAYHWFGHGGGAVRSKGQDVHWEGRRTGFQTVVQAGQEVKLRAVLEAPGKPGLWHFQWDLVEEGVCWFSERTSKPQPSVGVLVVPDPLGHGIWWSLLMLTAAAAAVSVWRSGRPGTLVVFVAYSDLAWCVFAVSVKQIWVLAESGARPTISGWLLIVAGASALGLVTFAVSQRYQGWARWLLVAGITLFLWADAVYLRFFGDLPSAAAVAGFGQLGRVEASIRELLAPRDIWLWLDLLPGLVLVLVADRLRRGVGSRSSRIAVGVLLMVIGVGGVAAARVALTQQALLGQVFRRVAVAEEIGVLNLHAVDGAGAVARRAFRSELSTSRFDELVSWFRQRAPQRAGTGPSFGVADGFNLVMVQVESLQTFVIGLEVGGREVTPYLNRWAKGEALWFSNVTDQTGQGRSSDSELATQVSLMPMAGGAAAFRFSGNEFTGMAGVLGENGYDSFSAVPYDGAFWNRHQTHPAYGFARSLFIEDFEAGESVGWGLSDRDFLNQAARRIASADRPFAAYLLTLSLHHPFDGFPAHLEELDVGDWDGTAFGNFLHTMHFFDASLAAFVDSLDREGLGDSTVIAIWGDHDAGFQWRPRISSAMGASHDPAGWYLSQEVPLFIRVPGAEELRGERTVPAGHTDVAPTLLALLGVDPAPHAFVGRNLLGDHGDQPVVGEYGCWRNATHLFLQGDGSLETGTCIDLATMDSVVAAECREGFTAAATTETVSALVIEYDLQRSIHSELVAEPGKGQ